MAKSVQSSEQLSLAFCVSESADSVVPSRVMRRGSRGRRGRRQGAAANRVRGKGNRCIQCGAEVIIPSWLQGLSLHYCSPECRQAWVAEMPSFDVSLEEPRHRKRGANWDVQSMKARERDGFACRVCGIGEEELGGRLDVHHQIPYRRFKSNVEANKLEHLVSVCPSCHGQLEGQLRRDLPLFASV